LDSNGDGIGDLNGITSKIGYLKELGVDVVWLSPIYRSPNDDNGYDISGYREIMGDFGTMEDFDRMLDALHAQGIKLVMDLVVNHTSDEHDWFKEACQSKNNPYRDYYIWSRPGEDGGPPNNWEAAFSGSAWEYHQPTGEYYLHMFSKKQPDLNWENPKVRAEVYDLMRFWLDKGVDGFRMDVITLISKPFTPDGRLPSAAIVRDGFLQPGFSMVANGPRLFEFLREMNREVLSRYAGLITVGEAPIATTQQGNELTDIETGVLDMIFHFEHMEADYAKGIDGGKWVPASLDLIEFKDIITRWQVELHGRGWNSLYLCNHDQPRPVSRFGDEGLYRVESAKMLATFLHGLQGTPYIYQGEEIGMTNMPFSSIEQCRDIESINMYRVATTVQGKPPEQVLAAIRAKGRDNARTPMQWSAAPHAGFTTGVPWIEANPNSKEVNVDAALADPNSIFHFYRQLIALRKSNRILVDGEYSLLLREHREIYAYMRTLGADRWLIVCNFGAGSPEFSLPNSEHFTSARLVIANYPLSPTHEARSFTLRPYEARIYQLL